MREQSTVEGRLGDELVNVVSGFRLHRDVGDSLVFKPYGPVWAVSVAPEFSDAALVKPCIRPKLLSAALGTQKARDWRRVPESNRSSRICNPLRNLSANPPEPCVH
jgi:hypothetical protein